MDTPATRDAALETPVLPGQAEVQDERGQTPPKKPGGAKPRPPAPLAAYNDQALSPQAAEQLADMLEDSSVPAHKGEPLPQADRDALLRKARQARPAS